MIKSFQGKKLSILRKLGVKRGMRRTKLASVNASNVHWNVHVDKKYFKRKNATEKLFSRVFYFKKKTHIKNGAQISFFFLHHNSRPWPAPSRLTAAPGRTPGWKRRRHPNTRGPEHSARRGLWERNCLIKSRAKGYHWTRVTFYSSKYFLFLKNSIQMCGTVLYFLPLHYHLHLLQESKAVCTSDCKGCPHLLPRMMRDKSRIWSTFWNQKRT